MNRVVDRLLQDTPIPRAEFIAVEGDSWLDVMAAHCGLTEAYAELGRKVLPYVAGGGVKLLVDGKMDMGICYGVKQNGRLFAVDKIKVIGPKIQIVSREQLPQGYMTKEDAVKYIDNIEKSVKVGGWNPFAEAGVV